MNDALKFWGKAQPSETGAAQFHPLVFHGLDVAACFEKIVAARPQTGELLTNAFDAPLARLLPGLTALVALHDIGKALPAFQMKMPALCPPAVYSASCAGIAYNHAEGGGNLLKNQLRSCLTPIFADLARDACLPLLRAVAHHHGKPLPDATNVPIITPTEELAVRRVADAILDAFGPACLALPRLDETAAQRLSWALAGLISLADWLGSSEHFPYVAPEGQTAAKYWRDMAQPRARAAVAAAGLDQTLPRLQTGGSALFGPDFTARPAQRTAEIVDLGTGPQLFILEEMTGAGKTEAALILAHRLMAAGRAAGLFIALPTTATADAMYQRMAQAYSRLFAESALPSLSLAHGRRNLNDGFRASLFTGPRSEELHVEGNENRAACNAFFADDRRKAFLADVGVGTVDQALMAVLPTKYAMLRQYGLSDKVLIIDEAHAYDAYMSKEVERLLTFHAAAGGSAILLSATLPQKTRTAFGQAFRSDVRHKITLSQNAYPLLTRIPATGPEPFGEHRIVPTGRAPVGIRRLDTSEAALDLIVDAAHRGAAVAYIRNAVDDARETAEALRARGVDVILFHARFAMGDRLEIEKQVLATFGKTSDTGQRKGKVLVATQVAEQSLDLDFDVMISDLAPVDLLIQRAGRLWRHQRGRRPTDGPVLHIVSPEPLDDAGKDWLRPALQRTASVYKAHGILWLTAKTVFEVGRIEAPGDMRRMIEAVYAPDLAGAEASLIPEGLRVAEVCASGERHAGRAIANQNLLDLHEGYCVSNRPWQSDTVTPTRLGEQQCTFRLAIWQDGRLHPWATTLANSETDPVRLWALSEISLRASQAGDRPDLASPLREAVAAIETRWQSLAGDGTLILPLEQRDGVWTGTVTRPRGDTQEPAAVRYAPDTGLVIG